MSSSRQNNGSSGQYHGYYNQEQESWQTPNFAGSGVVYPSHSAESGSAAAAAASAAATAYQQPHPQHQHQHQHQVPSYHASNTSLPSLASLPSMPSLPSMAAVSTSTPSAEVSTEEVPAIPASVVEERWMEYNTRLAGVFREISNGNLDGARQALLTISGWMLTQVTDLGLHIDDADLFNDRIKLWDNFNHAWLALLQRQQDMMAPGCSVQPGQTLMSLENLEALGVELTKLCDGIERHGMVDYQYGVWEEQIMAALIDCCNIYEPDDQDD